MLRLLDTAPTIGLLTMLLMIATVPSVSGDTGATGPIAVSEEAVDAVAARLRCVVCQNLSVADSPSEMAHQMRGIVRERLASGETPEQVITYFVERYGEWILLTPTARGFNLLVWVMPAVALGLGILVVAVSLRRWTRRRTPPPADPVDPEMRQRIRAEMDSNQ
jgi:cytochrome c-type biogenesis protein CcmH